MNRKIKFRGKIKQKKDEFFEEAELLSKDLSTSASMLVKRFKIGYSRAYEILEQIKNKDKQWIYGYYFWSVLENKYYIVQEDRYGDFQKYEVIPETVSQYTGLKDKNGVEIFERRYCKWNLLQQFSRS